MNDGHGVSAYPLVPVVIANFNSGDYLVNCVASAMAAAYPRRDPRFLERLFRGTVWRMLCEGP